MNEMKAREESLRRDIDRLNEVGQLQRAENEKETELLKRQLEQRRLVLHSNCFVLRTIVRRRRRGLLMVERMKVNLKPHFYRTIYNDLIDIE